MAVDTQKHVIVNASFGMDDGKIDLLKRTICKDATNSEMELFIHACKRTGLDPFMRQIYFVKMGGQMTIQTGIDGYRLIAERSGKYMPGKEPTFTYDSSGRLFSATSYVKKLGPDNSWHEIAATSIFSEYKGKGPLWESKPHVMLAKCSEVICLRKAFPADLSGIYTKEEMEQAELTEIKNISSSVQVESVVECISSEEAQEIENMLLDEEGSYRDDLLKFFTNASGLKDPMTNFFNLQKKFHSACLKSINKRKEERVKKESIARNVKHESGEF